MDVPFPIKLPQKNKSHFKVQVNQTKLEFTWFFSVFHVELKYVIIEMINWMKMEGGQFQGTMGQAFLPFSSSGYQKLHIPILCKRI